MPEEYQGSRPRHAVQDRFVFSGGQYLHFALFRRLWLIQRFQPEDSAVEVSLLKDARLVVIDSVWGHMGE